MNPERGILNLAIVLKVEFSLVAGIDQTNFNKVKVNGEMLLKKCGNSPATIFNFGT